MKSSWAISCVNVELLPDILETVSIIRGLIWQLLYSHNTHTHTHTAVIHPGWTTYGMAGRVSDVLSQ
jgi:hypothetical protein